MTLKSSTHLFFAEALSRLQGLAALVPAAHAAYRPLVSDGLMFFLGQLPAPRFEAIIAEQLALPPNASNLRRLIALFRQCPTLHKLGQVVAHDRRLDLELRQRLQTLESLPPTTPIKKVLPQIRQATRHIAGLKVSQRALAEASVAIVIPFTWPDAPAELPQRGVFKVLRPGVVEKLAEELPIWSQLGAYLEERCVVHGLPNFSFRDTLESVARLLAHEIRLEQEQAHLAEAQNTYGDWPQVLIPKLFPFCTPKITAMERVDGHKITEIAASPWSLRQRARLVVDALLARPFWQSGAFHADPHAGNLMITPDNRLAILDWALMTQLNKTQREAVMRLMLAALSLNNAQVCRAVVELGSVRDPAALQAAVAESLTAVRWGRFPGFDWLTNLLDRLASKATANFPNELVLFRKALLTLSGVVADISEQASVDAVLLESGAVHFFRHLSTRLLAPTQSRHAGIQLSNTDLLGVWLGAPATAWRFWFPGQ